jgi:hypothetical protein
MTTSVMLDAPRTLKRGMVVKPAADLIGIPSPHRNLVLPEHLGPGVVEKTAADGRVRVHWLDAELDAWMNPADLEAYAEGTRVITVYQCNGRGTYTRLRHRLVDGGIGIAYNWVVELRPGDVIRLVRDDGSAWTFHLKTHPMLDRIVTRWPDQPPEDDDAEAFTVAELAIGE